MLELMARFDFPVDGASIEGYTDNTAQDGDTLIIRAFDAAGNLLAGCGYTHDQSHPAG